MLNRIFTAIIALLVCLSVFLKAEINEPYSSKSLYFSVGFWDNYIVKNNQKIPIGMTANRIFPLIESSFEATLELTKYKNQNIIGTCIGWGGIGLIAVANPIGVAVNDRYVVPLSIFIGGSIALMAGIIVSSYSMNHLHKALWLYNNSITPPVDSQSSIAPINTTENMIAFSILSRSF
jgi:hypothetical protein